MIINTIQRQGRVSMHSSADLFILYCGLYTILDLTLNVLTEASLSAHSYSEVSFQISIILCVLCFSFHVFHKVTDT